MKLDEYQNLMAGRRAEARNVRSKDKEKLGQYLLYGGLPWQPEYRFHPVRRWLADWALVEEGIIIEYQGAAFTSGHHTLGIGYSDDCEKFAEAAILGYLVIAVTGLMVRDGRAFNLIDRAVQARRKGKDNVSTSGDGSGNAGVTERRSGD